MAGRAGASTSYRLAAPPPYTRSQNHSAKSAGDVAHLAGALPGSQLFAVVVPTKASAANRAARLPDCLRHSAPPNPRAKNFAPQDFAAARGFAQPRSYPALARRVLHRTLPQLWTATLASRARNPTMLD